MIGACAVGATRISGLLEADDVLRTVAGLRAFGVQVERVESGWVVHGVGVGGFIEPDDVVDLGNSGTGARLLLGLIATQGIRAQFTGDISLRSRPMKRVIEPLSQMGAVFDSRNGGRMPLLINGCAEPVPIDYVLPLPSAQVKSAVLLAALNTPGRTTVTEGEATRDHTENMLKSFGASVDVTDLSCGGRSISVEGYTELKATAVDVPGDPSSAAFPGVAALIVKGSEVTIDNIGLNPLRAGLFETLAEMGADIVIHNLREIAGEAIADITFRYGPLTGVDIPATRAPTMIDEYPIAAIAAACAKGETRMRGLAELRVKESDRFSAIVNGLRACGVNACADGEDIVIVGCGGPLPGGAVITVNHDHRIAMAFLVSGMAANASISIDDEVAIGTSFPSFVNLMNGIGGHIATEILE
jgi:3-phosphoshikimate 1-carboxyvinyltransferase